jgi:hypothetical protein
MEYESEVRLYLAQDKVQRRDLVNMVMNLCSVKVSFLII